MARDNAGTLAPQLADPLPPYERRDARLIECPVLLMEGERSPRPFRRNVAALAEWIPGARRVLLPGASHGMSFTHAAAFNRQLGAALEEFG